MENRDASWGPLISEERRRSIAGRFANPIRATVKTVIFLVLCGIFGLGYYLPHAMRSAAVETAVQSNLDLINQVKLVRSYYAENVLKRATAGGTIKPSADYRNHANQLPLPATLVKDLSALMEKNDTRLALVSPYPWPHRADRKMEPFEQNAWDGLQKDPEKVFISHETRDGQRILRVAVADRMTGEACIGCHNTDAQSVKRDWKLNDVRAVFEASRVIEPMLLRAEERSRNILIMVTFCSIVGCILLVGFMVLAERHSAAKSKADQQTYYLASHDMLTGLGNRVQLQQAVDAVFAGESSCKSPAFILLDLDRFKPINDTFGHSVGDKILAMAAQRLRALCQQDDVVARLGGDEFAILVANGNTPDQVKALAERLCQRLAEPFEVEGQILRIGASAGVSFVMKDADNTSDLLVSADLALYAAKATGRGHAHVYEVDLMVAALRRRKLEADLRDAIRAGALELHYQPILRAKTGALEHMEVLLRWPHRELGFVPPSEFIPIAEETGLIVPIGDWVIRKACADVAALKRDISVAVNLSPVQIRHGGLLTTVREALAQSGLPPERLEVEITEGVLLQNDQQTLDVLHALRAMGLGIALDDFGTGYSCLSYLQSYPISCIKIDRSFIATLGQEKSARPIISTIIAMAHNLGMSTVAEGVENSAQMLELEELGCDKLQGYYLGKPAPLKTLHLGEPEAEASVA